MKTVKGSLQYFWQRVWEIINTPLFHLGDTNITPLIVLIFLFSCIFLLFFAKKIRNILVKRVFSRYDIDQGTSKAMGTIVYYIIIVLGFFIIIQTIGVDLTGISVVAGALSVGIGFGLQNITNNFISGVIILFERPIKEGDWITVGETNGTVTKISGRSTTVLTLDNVSIIVPNSEFINGRVTNWSHNDRIVRFKLDVGVSYKEDPEQIRELLLDVANRHPGVLKDTPYVLFKEFGDSSLNFVLTGMTTDYIDRPGALRSELYFEIHKIFKKNNIEIPFPQRDLHIRSDATKQAITKA